MNTSATTPTSDKARQAVMMKIDKAMQDIDKGLSAFISDKDRAESAKDARSLQARIDAAGKDAGPAGTRLLSTLHKSAEALAKTIWQRGFDMFGKRRRVELQGSIDGKLAEALLDIGRLQDAVLTKMMFAEHAAMRARMDKAEKSKTDLVAIDLMGDIDDEMQTLHKRIRSALAVSAWLAGGYRAMLKLTGTMIDGVPSERCRRLLRAELDFVEAAKSAALRGLDVKAVENATVAGLRSLSATATRLTAEAAATDRELLRVGKLVKAVGAPPAMLAILKGLAQEKAAGWPQARSVDELDKALGAFEKKLAGLARDARRAHEGKVAALNHA